MVPDWDKIPKWRDWKITIDPEDLEEPLKIHTDAFKCFIDTLKEMQTINHPQLKDCLIFINNELSKIHLFPTEFVYPCPVCEGSMYEGQKGEWRCKCGFVLLWDPLEDLENHQNGDIKQLVEKVSRIFSLSPITIVRIKWLISFARNRLLHSGTHPHSIPAAAIYLAGSISGESLTQKMLAKALHITSSTIRKHSKELNRLLPDDWLQLPNIEEEREKI